jgi:hypothetical protein
MKMEGARSSEMLVAHHNTTKNHNQEDFNLNFHHHKNHEPCIATFALQLQHCTKIITAYLKMSAIHICLRNYEITFEVTKSAFRDIYMWKLGVQWNIIW